MAANKQSKRPVWDFFNPNSVEHIGAYRTLQETGSWPNDFWEMYLKDLTFPPNWNVMLMGKMTDEWVKRVLKDSRG